MHAGGGIVKLRDVQRVTGDTFSVTVRLRIAEIPESHTLQIDFSAKTKGK
jgi:hypothetical protein